MTIGTTSYTPAVFAGDNASVNFSPSWKFFEETDLEVSLRVIATGVETVQVLTTHYTVTKANDGIAETGTVVMGTPPTTLEELVIRRNTLHKQPYDVRRDGGIDEDQLEAQLDRMAMAAQEDAYAISRAIRQPSGEDSLAMELPTVANRASQSLGFDAAGLPIALAGTVSGSVTVTPFMADVLDDPDGPTARATLGVPSTVVSARGDLIRGDSGGSEEALAHPASARRFLTTDANDTLWSAHTIPAVAGGDALKLVRVNAGETGYEHVAPIFSEDSGWLTIAATLATTFASAPHGLTSPHILFVAYLECLVIDNGYQVGDRVIVYGGAGSGLGDQVGLSVWFDASNVGYSLPADEVVLTQKGGTTRFNVTAASWKVVARAFA